MAFPCMERLLLLLLRLRVEVRDGVSRRTKWCMERLFDLIKSRILGLPLLRHLRDWRCTPHSDPFLPNLLLRSQNRPWSPRPPPHTMALSPFRLPYSLARQWILPHGCHPHRAPFSSTSSPPCFSFFPSPAVLPSRSGHCPSCFPVLHSHTNTESSGLVGADHQWGASNQSDPILT